MFLKLVQSYAPMLLQRAHEKLAEWDQEVIRGLNAANNPRIELVTEDGPVTIPDNFVPHGQISSEMLKEFEPDAMRILEGVGTTLDSMVASRSKSNVMQMATQFLHAKAQQADGGNLTDEDAKQAVAIAKAVEKYALAE